MISDDNALEYFNKIKSLSFSNKSGRGQRGCDLRAHKGAFLLLEYGVDIEYLDKAWLHSLSDENSKIPENIRAPIDIIDSLDDELDFDENGQFRNQDRSSPKPYNVHVAPVLKTSSGKELVFDTFFYDEPPTFDQWLKDFKPYKDGTEIGLKRTDISFLYFEHTTHDLPKYGSLSRILYDAKKYAEAAYALRQLKENPPPYRLKAQWRAQELENNLEHVL